MFVAHNSLLFSWVTIILAENYEVFLSVALGLYIQGNKEKVPKRKELRSPPEFLS
jgi:hypothetical protein